jgi:hypothetical protein
MKNVTITPQNVQDFNIEVFTANQGWFTESIETALLYAMGLEKGSSFLVEGLESEENGARVLHLTNPSQDQGGWDILPFVLV